MRRWAFELLRARPVAAVSKIEIHERKSYCEAADLRAQKSTEKLSISILTSSTIIPKTQSYFKPVCSGGISFELELIGGCPGTDANMFKIAGIAIEFCLRFSGICCLMSVFFESGSGAFLAEMPVIYSVIGLQVK
jgi:hypothetical protein